MGQGRLGFGHTLLDQLEAGQEGVAPLLPWRQGGQWRWILLLGRSKRMCGGLMWLWANIINSQQPRAFSVVLLGLPMEKSLSF